MKTLIVPLLCSIVLGCSFMSDSPSPGAAAACPEIAGDPVKLKMAEAMSEGCKIRDFCTADMSEFLECWRRKKVPLAEVRKSLELQNHPQSQKFLSSYTEGDEIWHYRSPASSWKHHAGSEGFALYRNGRLVGAVQTRIE